MKVEIEISETDAKAIAWYSKIRPPKEAYELLDSSGPRVLRAVYEALPAEAPKVGEFWIDWQGDTHEIVGKTSTHFLTIVDGYTYDVGVKNWIGNGPYFVTHTTRPAYWPVTTEAGA